ncbi:acyltransferase family protein [Serratia marcescens]
MRENLNQIQWLRGIAAVVVIFTHIMGKAYSTGWSGVAFERGGIGVDIFFIISGFIMMYVCDGKPQSSVKFIKNRALRILPLHYLILVPLLLVYSVKPGLINSTFSGTYIIESVFLIPVKIGSYQYLNPVVWTLCYEMMFYIIFSLFLSFNDIRKTAFCTVVVILSLVIAGFIYRGDSPLVLGITNSISVEFCMGMMLYLLYKNEKLKVNPYVMIGAAIVLYFAFDKTSLPRFVICGLPSAVLFVGFINLKNKFIRPLNVLGDISYEIYISHILVVTAVYMVLNTIGIHSLAIYIAACVTAIIFVGLALHYGYTNKINGFVRRRRIATNKLNDNA